ncbi:MAG TPA: APC family permease [Chloroflexota bacterium]|nr:APC family permease [Chloroflexota bacterium]
MAEDQDQTSQRRGPALTPSTPELEWREIVRGPRPGDVHVRIGTHRAFRRQPGGFLAPRPEALEPQGGLGRLWHLLRRALVGAPIATAQEMQERLNKIRALAVFSSDALSSVAYGPEETMRVLVLAGGGALALTMPISIAIVVLLAIVVISYQQTIRAYPSGGGSYIVANDNLGRIPGLVAAASLLIDYVLTVSVSIASGADALVSAFDALLPFKLVLTIAAVLLIMLANLRGIRESGTIFALPTYVFIASILGLVAVGAFRAVTGQLIPVPPTQPVVAAQPLTLFLLLSAFAQGCSAMTGVEAVSNGVPAFKPPESRNARITLIWMGTLLGTMVLGVGFLASHLAIVPDPTEAETVVSQIARATIGDGLFYYVLQFATALILVLAANTSFADFPRLASILARDRFMPSQFAFRGDRLAFTTGIVALALLAIALLVGFRGSVNALIPLYAVGVFSSFTLSQAGMVMHWRRLGGPGAQRSMVINGVGAVATGIVTLVIAVTKFEHGAWMVIILIPILIALFLAIHRHYQRAQEQLQAETPIRPEAVHLRVIVPVSGLNVPARQALALARAICEHPAALYVAQTTEDGDKLRREWHAEQVPVPLAIIESPYRSLVGPILAYIDAVRQAHPKDTLMVILPEFVPSHWWEHFLHNQTAFRLKAALLFRPGVTVTSVPYLLRPAGVASENGGTPTPAGAAAAPEPVAPTPPRDPARERD